MTEKTTALTESNIYCFEVAPRATKPQIERAISELYGVKPIMVNITKRPPKIRQRGGVRGTKPALKKALVYLKEGDKITIV